jgi:hypothetical protein
MFFPEEHSVNDISPFNLRGGKLNLETFLAAISPVKNTLQNLTVNGQCGSRSKPPLRVTVRALLNLSDSDNLRRLEAPITFLLGSDKNRAGCQS